MKIFLIILAVFAVLIGIILSLSVTFTLIYDNGLQTKINFLFIEKDIKLSKLLSFVLFPEKKAEEIKEEQRNKSKINSNTTVPGEVKKASLTDEKNIAENIELKAEEKVVDTIIEQKKKPNPIKKIWDEEGIVGILSLVTNIMETANSAVLTLIRGLHIYSLYVMIIVGGADAASIAQSYGRICSYYYPVKGLIKTQMKVDNYDDYIQPDFIAPSTAYELQLIGSMNVALVLKIAIKAGVIFLKNLLNNKKGDK